MPKKVKVLVLRTAGTNCNEETAYAFESCGAAVEQVHVNALMSKAVRLQDAHILAIPGGFSHGDDIASGRILANELRLKLKEDLNRFLEDGKLMIGICNGFQILTKAGILPNPVTGTQETALFHNDSGKFEDRWVHVAIEKSKCVWTKDMPEQIFLPVAHGEGKFIPRDEDVLSRLIADKQVVFRYCSSDGKKPGYPNNPNGSVDDIAGICDTTGRIFGLMPHPERHFLFEQHPYWTRLFKNSLYGDGAKIFANGVNYIKSNF